MGAHARGSKMGQNYMTSFIEDALSINLKIIL